MGDSTPFPNPAAIARAEVFTREQFVSDGETLEDALAAGSARRRALDAALAEIEEGGKQPSVQWRTSFSLMLGLERVLSEEEPHLADGTVLSAHQVDALSGTLTALLAEAQRNGSPVNGNDYVPVPEVQDDGPDPALEVEEPELDPDDDLDEDDDEATDGDGEPRNGPRRSPRRRSPRIGRRRRTWTRTSSWTSSLRIRTPPGGSGLSTPQEQARRSLLWALWRPPEPAGS